MAHFDDITAIAVHRSALECLPESVAREESVLPIALEGRTLRVIVPDLPPDYLRDLLEKIAFLIDGEVIHHTADKMQIDLAVDYHYRRVLSEVTNCPLRLRVSCPKKWIDLAETEDESIRYCPTCSQNVFLCRTVAELERRSTNNQCVAYHEYKSETLGMYLFSDTVDEC